MNTSTSIRSATEQRAITLLGSGLPPESVASAVGVTVSRISQLVSDPEFMAEVTDLRFKNLSKHNERDNRYDTLEDKLLEKLENCLPMMYKPLEVLKAIAVINAAKRRGSSAPDSTINQQTVVSLTMPIQIIKQFTTNIQNQVIQAGEQELLTIQSSQLSGLSQKLAAQKAALISSESQYERSSDENGHSGTIEVARTSEETSGCQQSSC